MMGGTWYDGGHGMMGDIDELGKMCHHFAFSVNFSRNFVRLWAQSAENFTICPKFGIEN